MVKVKEQSQSVVARMLSGAPRVRGLVARAGVTYLGSCVIQDPAGWASIGPAWHVPDVGYVSVGIGVARWGTTKGLSELASEASAKPTLHAAGVVVSPKPNRVFACQPEAIKNVKGLKELDDGGESEEMVLLRDRLRETASS